MGTAEREAVIVRNIIAEAPRMVMATAFTDLSVGPCETDHAKNREAAQHSNQVCSFSSVAAHSCNRQLEERGLTSIVREHNTVKALMDRVPTSATLPLEDRVATYKRALGASALHRIDYICEQRAMDPHYDCITQRAWADWGNAWDMNGVQYCS